MVGLCVQKMWEGTRDGFPNEEHRIECDAFINVFNSHSNGFDKGKPAARWGRKAKGLSDTAL